MKTVIRRAAMTLGAFVGAGSLFAETFVWTGAEDAYWTNAANWQVEKTGGGGEWVVASRCPGVVKQADTNAMWTAMDADTDAAVFDATGVNPAIGYIDLDGQLSVKTVTFRGAAAPAYVFGSPRAGSSYSADDQRLGLPPSGTLTFDSTLGTAPTFTTGIAAPQGGDDNASDALAVTFVNDSSVECDVGESWGWPAWRSYIRSGRDLRYDFTGTGAGGFALGQRSHGGVLAPDFFGYYKFAQNANVRVYGALGTASYLTIARADGQLMTFNLEQDGVVWMKQHSWAVFTAKCDVLFTGTGTFRTYSSSAGSWTPTWSISSGKTVTFDCPFVLWDSSAYWHLSGGSGKIVFSADMPVTAWAKPVQLRGGTLEVSRMGLAGAGSPLGTGALFLGNADTSTFGYIGPGETTDRILTVTNCKSAAATTVTVAQRGTGAWTIGGIADLARAGVTDALTLENATAFDATVTGAITEGTDGALAVTKTGAGRWILGGANAYTGATTLNGGTLRLNATQTIGALAVTGDSVLEIADGATVTCSTLSRTAGTLDVQTSGTGKLVFTDAAFGVAGDWLTVNGETGVVQADGSLTPFDHNWVTTVNIPAKGGLVPETVAARDVVGITTVGTNGPITVEGATGAAFGGFVQKTATPATVHLDAEQDLSLSLLSIQAGAEDLTIGDSDEGTVTATAGTLTLEAFEPAAELVVRTPLAATVSQILKYGPGAVQVPVGSSSVFDFSVEGGAFALATGSSALRMTPSDIDGTFGGSVSVASETLTLTIKESTAAALVATGALTRTVALQNPSADLVLSNVELTVANSMVGSSTAADNADAVAYLTLTNTVLNGSSAVWQIGDIVPGVLTIEAGSAITNSNMVVGGLNDSKAGGYGAVYHRGGATKLSALTVGRKRYGYLEIAGGTLTVTGEVGFGARGGTEKSHLAGSSVLAIYNGATLDNSYNTYQRVGGELDSTHAWYRAEADRAQTHEVYVKNGYYKTPYNYRLNLPASYNTTTVQNYMGRVTVTVNGSEACFWAWGSPVLGSGKDSRGTTVNILNGGMLKASGLGVATLAEGPMHLNSNGGVFYWSGDVGGGTLYLDRNGLKTVVYAGGLTLRHGNMNAGTFVGPLLAASGKGVSAIDLPADVREMEFIGSPYVEIEGDGTNALAFAEFDSRTRRVTAIAVTSPGYGYTWAKAHLVFPSTATAGGFATNRADIACTLVANARGPLVFYGQGVDNRWRNQTLTLKGTNEVSAVEVRSGHIVATVQGAVPEDADVFIGTGTAAGGTSLNMTTNALRFASLSMAGNNGKLLGLTNALGRLEIELDHPGTNLASAAAFAFTNGTAVAADISCVGEWRIDAADLLAGSVSTSAKNLTFTSSASLFVTNVDQLDKSRRYTLLRFTNGATGTGLPTVTDPALAQAGWKTYVKENEILLKGRRGVAVLVR